MNTPVKEHPTVRAHPQRPALPHISEPLDAAWLRLCLDAGTDDVGFVEIDCQALGAAALGLGLQKNCTQALDRRWGPFVFSAQPPKWCRGRPAYDSHAIVGYGPASTEMGQGRVPYHDGELGPAQQRRILGLGQRRWRTELLRQGGLV
jgi:hypothetical protein